MLPLPLRLLNEQLSWRLRCSASLQQAPRELAQSFLPALFLEVPLGCPKTWGPALDSTEAMPTCCSLRVSAPTSSATGFVGWCFPRQPAALGPAHGACSCSCGLAPTPSAPVAWPQPPRRFSFYSCGAAAVMSDIYIEKYISPYYHPAPSCRNIFNIIIIHITFQHISP